MKEELGAAAAAWATARTRAGGFDLIFPFSAETAALARTTAAMHGEPVELDVVQKKIVGLVKAHHKTCTKRARAIFEALEAAKAATAAAAKANGLHGDGGAEDSVAHGSVGVDVDVDGGDAAAAVANTAQPSNGTEDGGGRSGGDSGGGAAAAVATAKAANKDLQDEAEPASNTDAAPSSTAATSSGCDNGGGDGVHTLPIALEAGERGADVDGVVKSVLDVVVDDVVATASAIPSTDEAGGGGGGGGDGSTAA